MRSPDLTGPCWGGHTCIAAVALVLGVVFCEHVAAANPNPNAIAPSIAFEIFMREKYPKLWNHKAVAIGPAGTFAASYRAASPDAAARQAVTRCETKLRWHPLHVLRNSSCTVYAVGSSMVFPAGARRRRARMHFPGLLTLRKPLADVARARVLFLPNCGRSARQHLNTSWRTTWFDLLAVRGFEVIVPTDTAAPCQRRPWQIADVVRARRSDARRMIKALQASRPRRPLYVWGDGEGAAVALTLDRSVEGIITTGHPCTYAGTRNVLVRPDVRVLVIQGEKQPGLDVASRRAGVADVAAFCASVLRRPRQRAIVVRGMDARAPISRTRVLTEASRFFRIAPPVLKPGDPRKISVLGYEALLRFNRTYRLYRNHKAVVLGPDGRDFVAAGHDSRDEAVQAALFLCNRAQTGNGFVAGTDRNDTCVIFALDDTITLPQVTEPLLAESVAVRSGDGEPHDP